MKTAVTFGRIAWLSDIHLDFLNADRRKTFFASIVRCGAEGVVISGDISNARFLGQHLVEMADATGLPVWFTLGNHDYYTSTVGQVRQMISELVSRYPLLHWLPAEGVVALREDVALVGVDSWADGRAGSYWESTLELSDHRLIGDLIALDAVDRLKVMQRYADEAEAHLRGSLDAALRQFKTVLIASHVPMFYEACRDPMGGFSDERWLPYFAWHQGGMAIGDILRTHLEGRIIALCGHTHTRIRLKIDERTSIWVATAEYDDPAIEDVLDLDKL
ncbi:MAG: metallophosphoesterase [bacterium]